MDEVDEGGKGDLAGLRLGMDALDLVVVAVDQRDQGPRPGRVAPVGFGEQFGQHVRGAGARGLSPSVSTSVAVRGVGVMS